MSDRLSSTEAVVERTGWVFNNRRGDDVTTEEFVASGDVEVEVFRQLFGLGGPADEQRAAVEIGAGIGRMTCALTRHYGTVYACDLDPGFLERCREMVTRFGRPDRLTTVEVADGRTLPIPPNVAHVALSYITLQHCSKDDAHELAAEAVRVVRPGGRIALNLRRRSKRDLILLPAGAAVRSLYRVPKLADLLARQQGLTRLAWQISRFQPDELIGPLAPQLTDIEVWTHSRHPMGTDLGTLRHDDGINARHWWLVATVV